MGGASYRFVVVVVVAVASAAVLRHLFIPLRIVINFFLTATWSTINNKPFCIYVFSRRIDTIIMAATMNPKPENLQLDITLNLRNLKVGKGTDYKK